MTEDSNLSSFDDFVTELMDESQERLLKMAPKNAAMAKEQLIFLVKRIKGALERLEFLSYYKDKTTFDSVPNGDKIIEAFVREADDLYQNSFIDLLLYHEEYDSVITAITNEFKGTNLEFLCHTPADLETFLKSPDDAKDIFGRMNNKQLMVSNDHFQRIRADPELRKELWATKKQLEALDKRLQKIKKLKTGGAKDEQLRYQLMRVHEIGKWLYYQYILTNDDVEDNANLKKTFDELAVVWEHKDKKEGKTTNG